MHRGDRILLWTKNRKRKICMSLKDWIIARGIVKLLDRDDFDEKLAAMIDALDKKLDEQFSGKESWAIQEALAKKLLVICQKLTEDNPKRFKEIVDEIL